MDLRQIIQRDQIIPSLQAADKREALNALSEAAARVTGLKARDVFNALWQREQLGSTGVGRGIAIPHGRMADVLAMTCIFARLDKPVDYGSQDGQPVDLIFLLLAPEMAGADHLKALARISRLMREPKTAETLRASKDRNALYTVLSEPAYDADLPKAG
jgi:nitrogen PTS system EIIA component